MATFIDGFSKPERIHLAMPVSREVATNPDMRALTEAAVDAANTMAAQRDLHAVGVTYEGIFPTTAGGWYAYFTAEAIAI